MLITSLPLFVLLLTELSTIAQDIRPEVRRYCRERDRLIGSVENDLYLLVEVEEDSTVALECHYCHEKNSQMPKVWFYQNRDLSSSEKEVELGMDNNLTRNRIHITPEISLILKSFEAQDAGIYKCHGVDGQEEELKYNYRLELIFKEDGEAYRPRGNMTDWESYRDSYLAPVSLRFTISNMPELVTIRQMGLKLEVYSEWSSWGSCERCVRKRGWRSKIAFCRVKLMKNKTMSSSESMTIPDIFSNTSIWPCRSTALSDEYPAVATATRYLPEFILEEKCKSCSKVHEKHKKTKFKYKKRYVLAEDAHLTITCPESSLATEVVWKKDRLTIKKGMGHSFRDADPEPRVLVDTFATIYLLGVSDAEAGNYTCYVDNAKMMQVQVIVVSKFRLLTQAFLRHMGYLAFILLMSSFCYCAGLVVICKQRETRFKIKDYRKIEEQEKEKTGFYDSPNEQ